jgi:hypothetical protein
MLVDYVHNPYAANDVQSGTFKMTTKNYLFSKFFCLLVFEATVT